MKIWSRERLEATIRRPVRAALLITGAGWLAGYAGFLDFSKDSIVALQGGFVTLLFIQTLLDARARKRGGADPVLDEPHPAYLLTVMIVFTGAAGIRAATKGGPDASAHVPYLILVGTILLALLGYTLASRHRDQIGEARFKSPADPD